MQQNNVKEDIKISIFVLVNIIDYLGNKGNNTDPTISSIILPTLQAELSHLYLHLDYSGLSKIITSEQVLYFLNNFSFTESKKFQLLEKEIIRTTYEGEIPEIPNEAWDLFWKTVDERKESLIKKIKDYRNTARPDTKFAFDYLYHNVVANLHDDENNFSAGEFRELSPFKWSKALLVGLGALVMGANGVLALPSIGATLASIVAGAAATGAAAGYLN